MDSRPARPAPPGAADRPGALAAATVLVGVTAHVAAGGGPDLSCLPLVLAAALGVAGTLLADRMAVRARRPDALAVGLVGAGQWSMHLALGGALVGHGATRPPHWGLGCGVVLAHAAAALLVVVLLLGVQRTLAVPPALLREARRWAGHLRPRGGPGPGPDHRAAVPVPPGRAGDPPPPLDRYGLVPVRRGPPA